MEAKITILIIFIVLGNVLCCEPIVGPFWSSTDGTFWDSIIGKTDKNGPGLVLYRDPESSLRHVFLSGESDWVDSNMTIYYPYFKNQMIFMAPLVKIVEPVVVRVDANNGKLLSNLSITVNSSVPNYFLVILGCNNVIYSMYGDIFYTLVANDATTGELIWETPYEGVVLSSVVLSDDCKYLTFLHDPLSNNLNYSVARLNAMTGSPVWETTLKINRMDALSWNWYVFESDVANRIAVVRYLPRGFSLIAYSFQLFAADSGMMTFEKVFPGAGIAVYYSPIVFSKDGTWVTFSPMQTYGIKIGGKEDVLVWSTGGTEGAVSNTYFSNSSKTVLFSLWNFGYTKYIAQNTNDGSLLWESSWIENVATQFFEYGADLLVLTGKALYKVDFTKCPIP